MFRVKSHFAKHPQSAAEFDALLKRLRCASSWLRKRISGENDALHFTKRVYGAKLCEIMRCCAESRGAWAKLTPKMRPLRVAKSKSKFGKVLKLDSEVGFAKNREIS